MGKSQAGPGRAICRENGLPAYEFPEDTVGVMQAMVDCQRWRTAKPRQPDLVTGDKHAVAEIIATISRQGQLNMSEAEARTYFMAYGVPALRTS